MYDAGNRRDIRKAEKAAERANRERLDYLAAAMSTTQGRAWFHDLLASCRLFADPFTNDALLEAYHKGERNVGLRIFADILATCPDQYIQMMREANVRHQLSDTAAAEHSRSTDPDGRDQGSSTVPADLGYDEDGSAD